MLVAGDVKLRFRDTVPLKLVVPEERATAADWPKAGVSGTSPSRIASIWALRRGVCCVKCTIGLNILVVLGLKCLHRKRSQANLAFVSKVKRAAAVHSIPADHLRKEL